MAKDGTAGVVLGTRSAIFTPMPNLGLIIIDEEKLFQGNSHIMIDSCTYIYILYIQVSVRDITLECLQITPTKFRGSEFPGNKSLEHRLSNFLEWGILP
jgi:hypothetical protein